MTNYAVALFTRQSFNTTGNEYYAHTYSDLNFSITEDRCINQMYGYMYIFPK